MKSHILANLILSATGLSIHAAQMTDSFADRPKVAGMTEILTADTSFATLESGETAEMHGSDRGRTVWAEWTAPADGQVRLDTAGSFERAVFAVYSGPELDQLHTVARGRYVGAPTPASARFPVTKGRRYVIVLDGDNYYSSDASGIGRVNIKLTAAKVPGCETGTDRFADRKTLVGAEAYGVANNEPAGLDAFQPSNTGGAQRDVWWKWTAPATGRVTLDTLESATDTVITVFAGTPVNDPPFDDLDMVARNENVPNSGSSRVMFQTQAGRTYHIAVGGEEYYNSSSRGNIILKLKLDANSSPPAIPGTDFFMHRGDLAKIPAMGVACNTFHGTEAFEVVPSGDAGSSAWWQWTAPETREVDIDTQGSEIDTMLRIYEGEDLETLVEVASNDNVTSGTWSKLRFRALKGRIYQIRVDTRGYYSDRGNITLNLGHAPGPEIDVQQPAGSSLADAVGSRSFGTVRKGREGSPKVFTIRNAGTSVLSGITIRLAGSAAGDFKVAGTAKTSLAPGEKMTFKVVFKPSAVGLRRASLRIASSDKDENPFDIAIKGEGSKP